MLHWLRKNEDNLKIMKSVIFNLKTLIRKEKEKQHKKTLIKINLKINSYVETIVSLAQKNNLLLERIKPFLDQLIDENAIYKHIRNRSFDEKIPTLEKIEHILDEIDLSIESFSEVTLV